MSADGQTSSSRGSSLRQGFRRFARRAAEAVAMTLARATAVALKYGVRGDEAHPIFRRHGFHLLRDNFYLPIPAADDLKALETQPPSQLVGVEMNHAAALELLQGLFPKYNAEFREEFPLHATPGKPDQPADFHLINGSFMAVDAHVYYALIRHHKSARVLEIGSGNSTRVAARAVVRNSREAVATRLSAIEPYPYSYLRQGMPGLSELIQKRVQDVSLDDFASLRQGDILFIDSTHALREGGDVQYEYCEILPRLQPGVLVHIHDISLPRPYPKVYRDQHLYWNEQYLLQAFLAFNRRFEVLWPGASMMLSYPEQMLSVFPEIQDMRAVYPQSEPSSFWMRVRSD